VTRNDNMIDDPTRTEALRSLRSTLQWLGEDVHYIKNEVDPIVEMCTITKAFDNSKALVANKIKGYPGVRMISNLYSTKARTAKLHGMKEFKDIKFKILDCIRNPIPPKIVSEKEAPCQEVFIPKEEIRNVEDLIPIAQHTYEDGARIFGAGTHFFYGEPWVPDGGSQLSMYRMGFREGQKYASINMVPGGGGDVICSRHPKGTRIPCTVNICPPVGAELVSVSTLNPVIFPYSTDKIGLAGALQGAPIELVKAKTIDAYAIAQSEWVLEGYVIEGQQVWETDEAERLGKQGVAPLHPEWARAMGHAYRTPRAFELTAITRRRDNPIVYTPHFGAFWYEAPFMCAAVYELCERMACSAACGYAWSWMTISIPGSRRTWSMPSSPAPRRGATTLFSMSTAAARRSSPPNSRSAISRSPTEAWVSTRPSRSATLASTGRIIRSRRWISAAGSRRRRSESSSRCRIRISAGSGKRDTAESKGFSRPLVKFQSA
jgi:hypothetical protein